MNYTEYNLTSDVELVEHMVSVGLSFMKSKIPASQHKDGFRLGFHKPPINS